MANPIVVGNRRHLFLDDSALQSLVVHFAMAHLSGIDRSQSLVLPETVEDYVGSDNPVRVIEAFAGGLDLAAASFLRVAAKETGL